MLDLNQMSVFIRVVQEGSFTGAARTLGIPKSRVSRMITDLEDKLGLRLLERTTREVRPTDVGLQYFEQYKPLFEEIQDIHSRISDVQQEPSGLLRVAAPVGFAIGLMGRWHAEFKQQYPLIDLEVVFTNGGVHLVRDGYDCGFAVGHLEDSSLIARKFDETDPVLCASPDFLRRYGPISSPEQLKEMPWVCVGSRDEHIHRCILVNSASNERIEIKQNASVMVNHHEVAIQHMLAGQGISVASSFFAYEQLIRGELVPILPEWQVEQEPLYLVFPSGRHLAKKVRAYIDFLMEKANQMQNLMDSCAHLPKEQQIAELKSFLEVRE